MVIIDVYSCVSRYLLSQLLEMQLSIENIVKMFKKYNLYVRIGELCKNDV